MLSYSQKLIPDHSAGMERFQDERFRVFSRDNVDACLRACSADYFSIWVVSFTCSTEYHWKAGHFLLACCGRGFGPFGNVVSSNPNSNWWLGTNQLRYANNIKGEIMAIWILFTAMLGTAALSCGLLTLTIVLSGSRHKISNTAFQRLWGGFMVFFGLTVISVIVGRVLHFVP